MGNPKISNPKQAPPAREIDQLSDEDIYDITDYIAKQTNEPVEMEFWLGELSRRRTERQLLTVAEATQENAQQVAEMGRLTKEGAAQQAEITRMTRKIERMTRAIVVLTVANVGVVLFQALSQ